MRAMLFTVAIVVCATMLFSCDKGSFDPQGGDLPTNYIVFRDSSFTPPAISIIQGSSITFLNQTSEAQSIITTDSITIPVTVIAANSFYFFKKDTAGTFFYHLTNKPAIGGTFTLTP